MTKQEKVAPWGYIAMAATILIWAGFAINMRAAAGSTLASGDVALLRFGVPALLLLPWWKATFKRGRTQSPLPTLAIVVGAGLPFMQLVSWGAAETSAALVGTITPGVVPLFVALYSVLILRKKVGWVRSVGVALITAGVMVALLGTGTSLKWGVLPLLAGGLLWASYTIALSSVSYKPLEIAVLLSVPSSVFTLIAVVAGLLPSEIVAGHAAAMDVIVFALMQGVIVGIISTVLYSYATKKIGSLKASGFGALSPVLSTVIAIPLLGETPSGTTMLCLGFVTCGVLLTNVVSNALQRKNRFSGSSQTAKQRAGLRSSAAPWLPAGHHGSSRRHALRHPESVT